MKDTFVFSLVLSCLLIGVLFGGVLSCAQEKPQKQVIVTGKPAINSEDDAAIAAPDTGNDVHFEVLSESGDFSISATAEITAAIIDDIDSWVFRPEDASTSIALIDSGIDTVKIVLTPNTNLEAGEPIVIYMIKNDQFIYQDW